MFEIRWKLGGSFFVLCFLFFCTLGIVSVVAQGDVEPQGGEIPAPGMVVSSSTTTSDVELSTLDSFLSTIESTLDSLIDSPIVSDITTTEPAAPLDESTLLEEPSTTEVASSTTLDCHGVSVPCDNDYCSQECPCTPGFGDCDEDEDCVDSVCVKDAGGTYDCPEKTDVCVREGDLGTLGVGSAVSLPEVTSYSTTTTTTVPLSSAGLMAREFDGRVFVGVSVSHPGLEADRRVSIYVLNYSHCGVVCEFPVLVESPGGLRLVLKTNLTSYGVYEYKSQPYSRSVYGTVWHNRSCSDIKTDFEYVGVNDTWIDNSRYLCDGVSVYCDAVYGGRTCSYSQREVVGYDHGVEMAPVLVTGDAVDVTGGESNTFLVRFSPESVINGKFNLYAYSEDGVKIGEVDPWYDSSLIAYWRFNDGSGTTVTDSSGNGLHGTASSSNRWLVNDPYCMNSGTCFNCSQSIYISLGTSVKIHMGNYTNWTFCGWERKTTNHGDLFAKASEFYNNNNNDKWTDYIEGGSSAAVGTSSVNNGVWQFVCGVYNLSGWGVAVNGTVETFVNDADNHKPYSAGTVYLCARSTSGGVEPKVVDEFRVYDVRLSTADMVELYNAPSSESSSSSSSSTSSSRSSSSSSSSSIYTSSSSSSSSSSSTSSASYQTSSSSSSSSSSSTSSVSYVISSSSSSSSGSSRVSSSGAPTTIPVGYVKSSDGDLVIAPNGKLILNVSKIQIYSPDGSLSCCGPDIYHVWNCTGGGC